MCHLYRSSIPDCNEMLCRSFIKTKLCLYLTELDIEEEKKLMVEEELDQMRSEFNNADRWGILSSLTLGTSGLVIASVLKGIYNISFLKSVRTILIASVTTGVCVSLLLRRWYNCIIKARKIANIRLERLREKINILNNEISNQTGLNVSYTSIDIENQIIPTRDILIAILTKYEGIHRNSLDMFLGYIYGPSGPLAFDLSIPAYSTEQVISDYKDSIGYKHSTIKTIYHPSVEIHETYPENVKAYALTKSTENIFIKS